MDDESAEGVFLMSFREIAYQAGAVILSACLLTGCIQPEEPSRLNSPPSGASDNQSDLSEFYAYHNDQGMVADSSIADIHFVPHSVHLSGTGEARLERYAELMAQSGGTLYYDTSLCDDELIDARLAVARSFLMKCGASAQPIQIVVGLPGGRGMNATEAAAGQAIARQPESRGTAYKLAGGGSGGGGSSGR